MIVALHRDALHAAAGPDRAAVPLDLGLLPPGPGLLVGLVELVELGLDVLHAGVGELGDGLVLPPVLVGTGAELAGLRGDQRDGSQDRRAAVVTTVRHERDLGRAVHPAVLLVLVELGPRRHAGHDAVLVVAEDHVAVVDLILSENAAVFLLVVVSPENSVLRLLDYAQKNTKCQS